MLRPTVKRITRRTDECNAALDFAGFVVFHSLDSFTCNVIPNYTENDFSYTWLIEINFAAVTLKIVCCVQVDT